MLMKITKSLIVVARLLKYYGYEILKLEGDTCVDFPMTFSAILFKKHLYLNLGLLFDELNSHLYIIFSVKLEDELIKIKHNL